MISLVYQNQWVLKRSFWLQWKGNISVSALMCLHYLNIFFSGLYKQALSAFLAVDDKNNQGSIKIFLSSSCNIVFRCVILIFPRVPKNKFEEKMVYCNYECAHV